MNLFFYLKTNKIKKTLVKTLVLSLATSSLFLLAPLPKVEANFDLETLFGIGVYYSKLNSELSYLDNDGRHEYMEQIKKKYGVNKDVRANAMLEDIMTRLTNSIAKEDKTILDKPYNYFVNNDKSFNAFCTLGHNLSVNIGTFETLNYNEDELAFVIAHEMVHGQKGDPINGVKKQIPLSVLSTIFVSNNGNYATALGAQLLVNLGTAKGITLPMELTADEYSFDYAVGAHYNPGAGAAIWQRIMEKYGSKKNNFVSTFINPSDHPTHIKRRDKFCLAMKAYSKDNVDVDPETGYILLKGKKAFKPASLASRSSLERAYLLAGELATAYHYEKYYGKVTARLVGNTIYLRNKAFMTVMPDDNANLIINAINN
jgi:Zn-dependent protease with chaperone function